MKIKRLVHLSLLISMALAISILESMIPLPFVAPGAKLGLSNIIILVSLLVFGFRYALCVSAMKSFLLMLITGSVTSFLYSFTGAILSTISMFLAHKYLGNFLTSIGISIIGAVAHNFAQVLVASLILSNFMLFTYLPILIFVGLFTGYFVGISSDLVSNKLSRVIKLEEK